MVDRGLAVNDWNRFSNRDRKEQRAVVQVIRKKAKLYDWKVKFGLRPSILSQKPPVDSGVNLG